MKLLAVSSENFSFLMSGFFFLSLLFMKGFYVPDLDVSLIIIYKDLEFLNFKRLIFCDVFLDLPEFIDFVKVELKLK